ncbi:autotransporter outer membrane beta-barrel domain-containing protein [Akkermansia sp.]|uniref:autotransporter outer membrane beta-barrel domain-containing protein n=1 Tax=Akkermansia sp. TaxID=1872421 RepID=UPI0025BF26F9|nr:autotransporter outer membrane beta-barrel domain-containing protein [Akkermansia sp.]MCC8148106.1 autotransporter outer membrane beta-barrel domain-containing protein [Akkermansia sp.]
MKPKLAVSAILFLMASSLVQTGAAQQSEDLYQGTVTARQETDGSITYNLKENLTFENFMTSDTVYAGSVFFNQTTAPGTAPNTSVMTFTGTGLSMSFENCSSVHSNRWTNDNEGGGAIRAEMLVFTDMGDLSFNGSKSIVNADTNAGGAVNVRGDATFSNMGNISFTNNELGDSDAQGQALGGALFAWGTITFENTKSILFSGNTTGHSPTEAHANIGGAIHAGAYDSSTDMEDYIPEGENSVSFQNIDGDIVFEDNSAWMAGAIYAYAGTDNGEEGTGGGMKIDGVTGNVIFKNNRADARDKTSDWNGNFGAVYSGQDLDISNVGGDLRFEGNYASNSAGAFGISGSLNLDNIGSITFINNHADGSYGVSWVTGDWNVSHTGDISISGNSADNYYGAMSVDGNTSFTRTGNITLDNNTAGNYYGVGFLRKNLTFAYTGDISISGNKSIGYGYGALRVDGKTSFVNTGKVTISGNSAQSDVGALQAANGLEFINNRGGVLIENNSVGGEAGAMLLYYGNAIFSADQGDIIVKGNTEKRGGDNPILNSLLFGTNGSLSMNSVALRAQEGRTVTFYDPFRNGGDGAEYDNIAYDFNKSEGVDTAPYNGETPAFTGTIRFSGAEADRLITQAAGESEVDWQNRLAESKYFNVSGKTTLYDGTLILEDGVTYGSSDLAKDSSFTINKGVLEITGNSSVNSKAIAFAEGVTLRAGRGATFRGDTIDFSKGVIFDLRPFMDDYSSGLHIEQANSHTVGGLMGVADTMDDYAHNRWATQQKFLALSYTEGTQGSREGDFDDIYSTTTGTNVVDSPYAYSGYWTKEWVDTDGDGTGDQLYAVWNPTGGIEDILPELAGADIGNSMWSSASNMKSVSNAALGKVGITRFLLGPKNNFWVNGLGDFTYHATRNGIDGYDYNGGGYAVGADRRFTPNTILGAAFGNLYGKNKSRTWISEVDQTSYVALLYGAWRRQMSPVNMLNIQGTLGYGWTRNKLDSYYAGGSSNGKWENRMGFATLQATWDHNLNKGWTLSPFLGIEYTQVNQNSFTETGYDPRHFDRGDLKNLSLPVGVGISKSLQFGNGVLWVNSLAVSYVPDVVRDNPETRARRLMNDFSWTARGSRPDRNAVRVNYNSTVVINPKWTAYAGYEFEGRSKSTYHRVNAGVSYAF